MSVDPGPSGTPSRLRPTAANTMRGVILMLAAFFLHSLSDVASKLLSETIHPLQIAWTRQTGLVAGVIVLIAMKGGGILRTRHPFLQVFRGLLIVASSASYLFALAYVPIADAVAVTFVAPFIVIILAALVLGERVGVARWIAVVVGFAGTLVIIRPGAGIFHPAIFLSLIAGAAFAIRQVISRYVSGTDPLATTVLYTTLTAAIFLSLPLPFIWQNPAGSGQLLLMVAAACLTGTAEFLVMRALDIAEAAALSPMIYTIMVWSSLWGLVFFGTFPDAWTLVGTALVIGSGIYTVHLEWRSRRE